MSFTDDEQGQESIADEDQESSSATSARFFAALVAVTSLAGIVLLTVLWLLTKAL